MKSLIKNPYLQRFRRLAAFFAALGPRARAADAHDACLVLGFRYPPRQTLKNVVSAWCVPDVKSYRVDDACP